MRTLTLAFLLTAAIPLVGAGCSGGSGSGSVKGAGNPSTAVVSCEWKTSTCDEYGGTVDPTFATNLQTTCVMHGVAYATAPCPSANEVPGYCDLGTTGGMTSHYHYYSPAYDATSAQADCAGFGVGTSWVP